MMDVAAHPDELTMHITCVGSNKVFQDIYLTSYKSEVVFNADEHSMNAIKQVSNKDAILIEFSYEGLTFYEASLYFPIDHDIARDSETVEKIIQLAKGEGLILSIDSNSRSTLWYDMSTNQRE
jgi:hypothetical protein